MLSCQHQSCPSHYPRPQNSTSLLQAENGNISSDGIQTSELWYLGHRLFLWKVTPHLHFNSFPRHKLPMRSADVLWSNHQHFTLSSIWHQREPFNLITADLWGGGRGRREAPEYHHHYHA